MDSPQANETTTTATYAFTPRELERLAIYRAAIEAEFYTDRCAPLSAFSETLACLPGGEAALGELGS